MAAIKTIAVPLLGENGGIFTPPSKPMFVNYNSPNRRHILMRNTRFKLKSPLRGTEPKMLPILERP